MEKGNNRLLGNSPRIGIRPTIDGRRQGVRESLEGQTMDLARAVKEMLKTHVFHPDGTPVECVIPETCIGGAAEAAQVEDLFKQKNVEVSLTVTPCWCYGTETMDTHPYRPKAIWGFNGTERPGAVYLSAVLAAHNQKGLPAFGIYGRQVRDAGDTEIPADVKRKILLFVRAGLAAAEMKDKSYLAIGNVSMGISASKADENFFQNYLGMRNEYVDMSEIYRRIEEDIYDEDEYERARRWVQKNCPEGADNNPVDKQFSREEKENQWDFVTKMALIARDLMVGNEKLKEKGYGEEALGHNAIAAGFQGQRQWTDHFPNGDFMEAVLNSSFDWNGTRQPYIMATENDTLNAVSMLFGHLLTNTAQIFADVRTYWSPDAVERVTGKQLSGLAQDGIIHLINSGSAALDGTGRQKKEGEPVIKPFWKITEKEVEKCLEAVEWRPASVEYFRGGGFSSQFVTEGNMPVTMVRINIIKGLGPVLQLAEGYTVDLPHEIHEPLNQRTDPTWPTTWFAPRITGRGSFKDVYSVMNSWGSNHASISYGHIGDRLLTLASLLRIPVNMHNVPEDKIFRPDAWNAFGTDDLQGADYRACENFGPMYS